MNLSNLSSRWWHYRWFGFLRHKLNASTFLRPFAPPALPGFITTMNALTPDRLSITDQVSLLNVYNLLAIPSPTTRGLLISLSHVTLQRIRFFQDFAIG